MHVAAFLRHAVSHVGVVLPAAHSSLGTGRRRHREPAALVGGSNTPITPYQSMNQCICGSTIASQHATEQQQPQNARQTKLCRHGGMPGGMFRVQWALR